MAAPKQKSLQDLSGRWKMNRDLSDDVDGVLQIQGFNTIMRKAIAYAPVYLYITQSQQDGNTNYKIDQKTTANIPAVNEEWITDWEFRETKDPVMGSVRAKARWANPGNVEDNDFLTGRWLDEGIEQVEAYVESVNDGWKAHQVWGFEEMDGQRLFVRRVVVQGKGRTEKVKLVYDFESD